MSMTANIPIVSQETAQGIARVLPNHGHTVDCAFCAAVGSDLAALTAENALLKDVLRAFSFQLTGLRAREGDPIYTAVGSLTGEQQDALRGVLYPVDDGRSE